jgi:hypothetical protein
MNIRKRILWITQTAMLLAIAVLSQTYLTPLLGGAGNLSQMVVGPIVNFCLVLAALTCGFWSGAAISAATPVIALMMGRMAFPQQAVIVALGNLALVFVFWLVCNKKIFGRNSTEAFNWGVASVVGSFAKFIVLWVGMTRIFISFVLVNSGLPAPQIERMTAAVTVTFSWPQLATALIGCILAGGVYKVLKPVLFKETGRVRN